MRRFRGASSDASVLRLLPKLRGILWAEVDRVGATLVLWLTPQAWAPGGSYGGSESLSPREALVSAGEDTRPLSSMPLNRLLRCGRLRICSDTTLFLFHAQRQCTSRELPGLNEFPMDGAHRNAGAVH
jgi:hypothetical protein